MARIKTDGETYVTVVVNRDDRDHFAQHLRDTGANPEILAMFTPRDEDDRPFIEKNHQDGIFNPDDGFFIIPLMLGPGQFHDFGDTMISTEAYTAGGGMARVGEQIIEAFPKDGCEACAERARVAKETEAAAAQAAADAADLERRRQAGELEPHEMTVEEQLADVQDKLATALAAIDKLTK